MHLNDFGRFDGSHLIWWFEIKEGDENILGSPKQLGRSAGRARQTGRNSGRMD
jgi:hypothetical protein